MTAHISIFHADTMQEMFGSSRHRVHKGIAIGTLSQAEKADPVIKAAIRWQELLAAENAEPGDRPDGYPSNLQMDRALRTRPTTLAGVAVLLKLLRFDICACSPTMADPPTTALRNAIEALGAIATAEPDEEDKLQ